MRVGRPRLQRLCSKKWVTDRMAEVDFRMACVAHHAGGAVRDTFTRPSVLRRMHGKITVEFSYIMKKTHFETCMVVAKQIPGRLILKFMNSSGLKLSSLSFQTLNTLLELVHKTDRLSYVVYHKVFKKGAFIGHLPKVVFYSVSSDLLRESNHIAYRPAFLNGRHIWDVVRTIARVEVDVTSSWHQIIKDEVTKRCKEVVGGVWLAPLTLIPTYDKGFCVCVKEN